jgi:hypothetical protein
MGGPVALGQRHQRSAAARFRARCGPLRQGVVPPGTAPVATDMRRRARCRRVMRWTSSRSRGSCFR